MTIDISRDSYRPERDYTAVVHQQGRVALDADMNEQAAIADRRLRALAIDLGGRAIVPASTPDGFAITLAAGKPVIGAGRLYVDGLLADNRGKGAVALDASLDEWRPSAPTPYDAQPWFTAPPAPPAGTYLAYLDVWRRPVTYVTQPDLVEKAIGVDTTARLQTVWQVRFAPVAATTCKDAANDPVWADITRPSAARLTNATSAALPATDPCIAPAAGGYRGLENQLYRVEIHDGGTQGQATFKWSRDNASVETAVRGIGAGGTLLTVDSLGRDDRLGFGDGDWVEVTDDVRELAGQPGSLRRIATGGGIEVSAGTIRLAQALPADFSTDPAKLAQRRTRVRRWDQSGRVLKGDGSVHADLDAGGQKGSIPLPPAGVAVALEDGITVAFNLAAAGAKYRTGEYWIFAARAADASIEPLDHVAPAGPRHHFARLAIVSANGIQDCRTPWPPAPSGDGCTCLGVPAGFDLAALPALLPDDRQVHLCLAAGEFKLGPAVVLDGGKPRGSLRITGAGAATRIVAVGEAGLVLTGWGDVSVEALSVTTDAQEHLHRNGLGILGGITAIDCDAVVIDAVRARAAGGFPAACVRVAAADPKRPAASVRIRGCRLVAGGLVSAVLVTDVLRTAILDTEVAAAPTPDTRGAAAAKRRGQDGLIGSPELLLGDAQPKPTKSAPGTARALVRTGKAAVAFDTPAALEDAWAKWYEVDPPARPFPQPIMLLRNLQQRAAKMLAAKGDVPGVPAFAAWFTGVGAEPQPPAAGIVVAGRLAEHVRIEGNDIVGARHGIRVALSHQAARSVHDVVGRVTIAGNRVVAAARSDAVAILVGNSASTTITGNALSVSAARGRKQAGGLEGIRLFGDLGRFAIVRENHITGFATGIAMTSLNRQVPAPLWKIADNLTAGAATAVTAPTQTVLSNNHP